MTKKYLYEMGDHVYETQAKAKSLWATACSPGKHEWDDRSADIVAICYTCGMIRHLKERL